MIDDLLQRAQSRRYILVCAPPAFGKTSARQLLAHEAEKKNTPVVSESWVNTSTLKLGPFWDTIHERAARTLKEGGLVIMDECQVVYGIKSAEDSPAGGFWRFVKGHSAEGKTGAIILFASYGTTSIEGEFIDNYKHRRAFIVQHCIILDTIITFYLEHYISLFI